MPRHLISDAHEWINEIPTVPIYAHVNHQARERTCTYAAGKEDPVELDSSLNLCGDIGSAEEVGDNIVVASEIPPFLSSPYFTRYKLRSNAITLADYRPSL